MMRPLLYSLFCVALSLSWSIPFPRFKNGQLWSIGSGRLNHSPLAKQFIIHSLPENVDDGSYPQSHSHIDKTIQDISEDESSTKPYLRTDKLVNNIINTALSHCKQNKGMNNFDPSLLMDNAFLITKGRIYEKVMGEKMEATRGTEDQAHLEMVDALMRGFISAERQQRARLKVSYVLAGAETGRLTEGIELLSNSQEIDEDLLSYLAGLIKTEQLKAAGPASRLKEEFIGGDGDDANGSRNGNDDGSEEMEEEKYISKAAKATLKVLRMVQRLLKAEMKTEKKTEVRLLTALLNEANPEERFAIIKTKLSKIEEMQEFAAFLSEGIDFLVARQKADLLNRAASEMMEDEEEEEEMEQEREKERVGEKSERLRKRAAQLPVGVVEQMKDILLDVQGLLGKLQTGTADGNIYSTIASDYNDKGPKASL